MSAPSFKAVFIGGCDRSGTTLLGSMLGTSQRCITTPESQFKIDLAKPEIGQDVARMLHLLRRHPRFKIWRMTLDPWHDEEKAELTDFMHWLIHQYAHKHGRPDWDVWVDHTPINIRFVPVLRQLVPGAKFIHLVRDGRAVGASLKPLPWGPHHVVDCAHYWAEHIAHGLGAELAWSDVVLRVRYEDLLQSPAQTLEHICQHIGVAYDSDMLSGGGFQPPAYTRHQHQLVGQPVDPSRINRWRSFWSTRESEIFESIAGNLLSILGYELDWGWFARGPTRLETRRFQIHNLIAMPRVRLHWWRKYFRLMCSPPVEIRD